MLLKRTQSSTHVKKYVGEYMSRKIMLLKSPRFFQKVSFLFPGELPFSLRPSSKEQRLTHRRGKEWSTKRNVTVPRTIQEKERVQKIETTYASSRFAIVCWMIRHSKEV